MEVDSNGGDGFPAVEALQRKLQTAFEEDHVILMSELGERSHFDENAMELD